MPIKNQPLRFILFPFILLFFTVIRKGNTTVEEQLELFRNVVKDGKITDTIIQEIVALGYNYKVDSGKTIAGHQDPSISYYFSKDLYRKHGLFPIWLSIKLVVSNDGSIISFSYTTKHTGL